MTSVGTIVWLSSELMFFAALFAMYFTLRAINPDIWADETLSLIHISEPTRLRCIPYAVFCLKKQ